MARRLAGGPLDGGAAAVRWRHAEACFASDSVQGGSSAYGLDSAVPPTRVLAAQPRYQIDDLRVRRRPQSVRALAQGSPLSAHELAMPPQDRFWTRHKSRPASLGKPFDNRRRDQTIACTPPRSAYLLLQHPHLMPQGQNFSLELCLLPIANAQQVDPKPDDRLH